MITEILNVKTWCEMGALAAFLFALGIVCGWF